MLPVNNELTPREVQVLNGIAEGLTNKEIASTIKLAVPTVGDYKKRLFAKLYVYNSAHAVAEGFRKGLVKVRESAIERADRESVKNKGGMLLKFISPGRNNVPDDILLLPVAEEHREIVARYFRFVEYKAPGEKPRAAQEREHERLRELGYRVDVVDAPGQLGLP